MRYPTTAAAMLVVAAVCVPSAKPPLAAHLVASPALCVFSNLTSRDTTADDVRALKGIRRWKPKPKPRVKPKPRQKPHAIGRTSTWPSVTRWRSLVARYFPAEQVDNALWTIQLESGGNPASVNSGSGCSGLMQVAPPFHGWNPLDAENNIRIAAKIWRRHGWGAWSTWH